MVGLLDPLDLTSGAQSLQTQEQITAQQKVAQAMLERARKSRPMTHWTQALAQGMEGAMAGLALRDAANASATNAAWNAQALTGDLSAPGAGSAAAPVAGAPTASSGSGVARGASLDPVAADLLPHQRAFLNAVAGPESAGRYNVRYTPSGGATFEGFDKHPAIYEKGPAGPSSAAGRYQFVKSTWDRLGGGDFSPENQDRKAWQLGQEDYKRNTGRDLDTDLRTQGFTPQIARALGSTWAGFKDNPGKAISAYASSIQRYGSQPSVAAADMPAPGARNVEMPGNGDGFVIPGPYREGQPVAEPLQAPVDRGTNLTPQEALQPLAQPAAAPMDGQTFNAITADAPLEPVFKSEGVSQPWMGTALPAQAVPAPAAVAQAAAPAPMPPARPVNLAMPNPQADMPAPGAKPAMLQLPVSPVTGMPDFSNENGAGARELMVAEALARQGQPSPFTQAAPAVQPMPQAAFASAPMAAPPQAPPAAVAAPVAPASPVERVAAVMPAQAAPAAAAAPAASPGAQGVAAALGVNPRVLAAATSPYASEGTRKIAQTIIQKQMEDAKYNRPDEVEARRLGIDLQRKQLTGDPLVDEGRRLENDAKRKALAKPADAPTTKVIKQADGSEVAVQWDANAQTWIPLVAPGGGNAVGGSPGNPYALPGKPTEGQSKDAGFAGRMVESHNVINGLESVGTDRKQAALGAIPWIGNSLSSSDKQKFEQAKRNFVTSVLRKESGAAISTPEFETEEKKYFPQVGDSPEVIAQKRVARELAIEGVMAGAGAGYKVPESYKPSRTQTSQPVDTSKPGSFRFNPATGKMEPA